MSNVTETDIDFEDTVLDAASVPAREGYWAVALELDKRLSPGVESDVMDSLMNSLDAWGPAVGTSERGWLEVRLNVGSPELDSATRMACALVLNAARQAGVEARVLAAQVMSEVEFDIREGWRREEPEEATRTEVLSTGEAASVLKVSTGRVRQMVASGLLAGRKVGERAWLFDRDEVERLAYTRS